MTHPVRPDDEVQEISVFAVGPSPDACARNLRRRKSFSVGVLNPARQTSDLPVHMRGGSNVEVSGTFDSRGDGDYSLPTSPPLEGLVCVPWEEGVSEEGGTHGKEVLGREGPRVWRMSMWKVRKKV